MARFQRRSSVLDIHPLLNFTWFNRDHRVYVNIGMERCLQNSYTDGMCTIYLSSFINWTNILWLPCIAFWTQEWTTVVTVQADVIFKHKENICGSKKGDSISVRYLALTLLVTIIATIITCLLLCEQYCNSPNLAYYYKYLLNEVFFLHCGILDLLFCVLGQCVIIELLL